MKPIPDTTDSDSTQSDITSSENTSSETTSSEKIAPEIIIRAATYVDRAAIAAVEALSTPGLRYVDQVFDLFMDRTQGAFLVAENDGEVVACGKFTLTPDGSAWLETLRVIPACQGLGIGKRFYKEFFTIARRDGVPIMRMYTGTKNVVSKGLAERFGFQQAETFAEARLPFEEYTHDHQGVHFQPVSDARRATDLIMQYRELWHDFLVMNRTFYKISPALCAMLAAAGQVYEESETASVIVLGARFMPEEALHIGLYGGDPIACQHFIQQRARALGVPRVNCIFPAESQTVGTNLARAGYQQLDATLIVMEVDLDRFS